MNNFIKDAVQSKLLSMSDDINFDQSQLKDTGKIIDTYVNDEIQFVYVGQRFDGKKIYIADRNIGATCGDTKESWYGDLYAWGETTPRTVPITWEEYSYGNYDTLTTNIPQSDDYKRYVHGQTSREGHSGSEMFLKPNDDIAHIKLQHKYPTARTMRDYDMVVPTDTWVHSWRTKFVKNYKKVKGLCGRLFYNDDGREIFFPVVQLPGFNDITSVWTNELYMATGWDSWNNRPHHRPEEGQCSYKANCFEFASDLNKKRMSPSNNTWRADRICLFPVRAAIEKES